MILSITSNIQRVLCQMKAKVINLNLGAQAVLSTPASYEPVNSIWQSISSEMLLLEKHFRPVYRWSGAHESKHFCRVQRRT